MEGKVPWVEEPDSDPENFHLSKQAGESHGNSESNSESCSTANTEAGIHSTAAAGAQAQFSNVYCAL